MTILRRQPVPPLPPPPPDGLLGHVIVTDTRGERIGTTDATLRDLDTAIRELAQWHARGHASYAIADVRLREVT